ncbi:MAG TPA: hypothetical protein VGW35_12375 [Methylomirabilota bacterium]|jgi:hypothetical protein|nr:hypothetical protein [Methylomirabilota bacterium]
MRQLKGFNGLREQRRVIWIEPAHGWAAAPEEILAALSDDGFEECKREMTTSRSGRQPAGGLWQGVDTRTGSVASAIWVNRSASHHAIVFVEVDGESLTGGAQAEGAEREVSRSRPEARSRAAAPEGAGA